MKVDCDCPIDAGAQIVGSKWVIVLLRDMFMGHKRFKDFLEENPTLSNKVLSAKLQEMSKLDLIEKRIEEPSVAYYLTGKGKALKPVLKEIARFGSSHCGAPMKKSF